MSKHSQTEQSIEGQLQTCHEFAKHNRHIVIGAYIDSRRAAQQIAGPSFSG